MTDYIFYYFGFSDAAHQSANNAAIAQLSGNPADDLTFSIPCSTTGTGTATCFGTCCPATQADVVTLQTAMAQGQLQGVTFYLIERVRPGAFAGPLVSSDSATAVKGSVVDWTTALADAGLQVIEQAMP